MPELNMEELERVARSMLAEFNPREHFLKYRDDALAQDRVKGRGYLVVNPESTVIPKDAHGRIVERDGKEYRIVVDKLLVGARDNDGALVHGYWLEGKTPVPLPTYLPLDKPGG